MDVFDIVQGELRKSTAFTHSFVLIVTVASEAVVSQPLPLLSGDFSELTHLARVEFRSDCIVETLAQTGGCSGKAGPSRGKSLRLSLSEAEPHGSTRTRGPELFAG